MGCCASAMPAARARISATSRSRRHARRACCANGRIAGSCCSEATIDGLPVVDLAEFPVARRSGGADRVARHGGRSNGCRLEMARFDVNLAPLRSRQSVLRGQERAEVFRGGAGRCLHRRLAHRPVPSRDRAWRDRLPRDHAGGVARGDHRAAGRRGTAPAHGARGAARRAVALRAGAAARTGRLAAATRSAAGARRRAPSRSMRSSLCRRRPRAGAAGRARCCSSADAAGRCRGDGDRAALQLCAARDGGTGVRSRRRRCGRSTWSSSMTLPPTPRARWRWQWARAHARALQPRRA